MDSRLRAGWWSKIRLRRGVEENIGGIALIRYSRAKFTANSTTSNQDVIFCSGYADTVE
jgi:hypothetical protein